MEKNFNKTIAITLFVMGAIFIIAGSTFAYFSASISSNGSNVTGKTTTFNIVMNITTIKNDKLIPVVDTLIDDTLNSTHQCTDTRGYGLCYLYKLTLNNNADAQTLTGYLKTISTTYTSNNLKYQLFTRSGNTYTAASDMKVVPLTANATSNFTLNNNDLVISLNAGTSSTYSVDYYLAIWLSDPGNNQLIDSDKTYNGSVTFSSSGGSVSADLS